MIQTQSFNQYSTISCFYRELIRKTGHLDKQKNLVKNLFLKYKVPKNAHILDAACGTGDIIHWLNQEGYTNVEGNDASANMLKRATELVQENILYNYRWEKLSSVSHLINKFDVILILSISILHTPKNQMKKVFSSIIDLLKAEGILIFDFRNWECMGDKIREPNRPENCYRWLADISFDKKPLRVDDYCMYNANTQIIKYKISNYNKPHDQYIEEVRYSMLGTSYFRKLINDFGLRDIEVFMFPEWPYCILKARK